MPPKIITTYDKARLLLSDGDVVFFSHHSGVGDRIIKFWQWVTHKKSESNVGYSFSHVGMVLTLGTRLFLLESSFAGGVRMVLLSSRQPDLIVKMKMTWNQEAENFALENLGRKYGLIEAIRAGLGLRETMNDRFICTEYVTGICNKMGYYFPKVKQLPNNFFAQLESEAKTMIWINNASDI